MSGVLRLVLGDQLTRTLSSLVDLDQATDVVLMVEVIEEVTYVKHHKRKVAFLGLGQMCSVAEAAAKELGEDFDCALIDPRFTKPIDEATIEYF